MLDLSQLAAMVVLLLAGVAVGWFWQRSRNRRPARTEPSIASQLTELRSVGELSVFKAVSKDILTQVDHSFGDFGRKYLGWAFSKKKLAMVFEFEMDFRYNLRSDQLRVETQEDGPGQSRRAILHLPPCTVDVSIKDVSFYDEQRAKFMPWLFPDLLQGFFDGRFSEEDKNRLIASAKHHALIQAQSLAQRYRPQVEQSAYSTLRILTKPLGFPELEVRFQNTAQVSDDVQLVPNVLPNSPSETLPEMASGRQPVSVPGRNR